MAKPYSIKIFLPGGDPEGLRTIEKSNWSGAGIMAPRTLLNETKQRRELARAGVYVLLGPIEESGLPRIYVGEGDPIRPRLEEHASKRDFWTHLIAFTSKDENLNKAHVQYLESRLVALAGQAKRCLIENGNVPALPSLSEADAADAEGFLSEILLCFPIMGVSVFATTSVTPKTTRLFFIEAKGVSATGAESHDGFVVRAKSQAVALEVPSCHTYLRELRATLLANGVLRADGDHFIFTQDYTFASPSTAAGVVQGRSANGRMDWKTKTGVSLKDVQEA